MVLVDLGRVYVQLTTRNVTGTEHCVYVTCSVMLKTLNVIQIYLLLCSPVLRGAFKFRSCMHITVGIKF